MSIETFFSSLVGFVWNKPVLYLCLFGGLFFSFRFLFIQFRCIPHAIQLLRGRFDDPTEPGVITHFQALASALSGTIGLGNIAGVAVAIGMGGPGSVLWMWLIGILGMATKFVECTLGTHFRQEDPKTGDVRGGAMYYIEKGLGKAWRPLGLFFAFAILFASFGSSSMFQTNQAASALFEYYNVSPLLTGIVLFFLTSFVIIGGIKRIGKVASRIVPLMCGIYVGGALLICLINYQHIPDALSVIFYDAFTGKAAAGGSLGAVIMTGVKRAIFSNEAGIGSAPIAHAAVKTRYPIREGIVASLGPFIDTVIVCTATALVIILSGNFGTEMYKNTPPSSLIQYSLSQGWREDSIDISPPSQYGFQEFREGSHVWHYESTHSNHSPLVFNNIVSASGLVRFSFYREDGDMDMIVRSSDGTILERFDLSTAKPKSHLHGMSIEGYHWNSRWSSYVIHTNTSDPLTFEFQPKGFIVNWYIDNITPVEKIEGIALTIMSFDTFFEGFGSIFITFAVFFFAFSTLITWSYYGEVATHYLTKSKKAILGYKWVYVVIILVGSMLKLDVVINFSDAMIGLLVIPNMIAILLLHSRVWEWSKTYFNKLSRGDIRPYK